MKTIVITALALILGGTTVVSFWHAADMQEISECKEWAGDAVQYSTFYLTKWQADQCAAHSIIINAPIQ